MPEKNSEAAPALEFWFDFSSPYGYFGAQKVEEVAARHGRRVLWRPFLIGVVFGQTKMGPMTEQPLRGDYARHDWERLGRLYGVPFRFPDVFPVAGTAASRIAYWLEAQDPGAAAGYAKACYAALFENNRDIGRPEVAAEIAAEVGRTPADALAANGDPVVRDTLRARTQEAIERGVFGSPFFIVGGEGFWGADRLTMVDDWLARGGW